MVVFIPDFDIVVVGEVVVVASKEKRVISFDVTFFFTYFYCFVVGKFGNFFRHSVKTTTNTITVINLWKYCFFCRIDVVHL